MKIVKNISKIKINVKNVNLVIIPFFKGNNVKSNQKKYKVVYYIKMMDNVRYVVKINIYQKEFVNQQIHKI